MRVFERGAVLVSLTLSLVFVLLPACGSITTTATDAASGDAGGAHGDGVDAGRADSALADSAHADSVGDDGVRVGAGDGGVDGRSACAQNAIALGAAGSFAVLAGSTVTNTGLTSVVGDVGVSPGTAVTGFPPASIVGVEHVNDSAAVQGIAAVGAAYDDAAGRSLCPISVSGNLGGMTLAPGLYHSTSSLEVSSGDLTLDAQGDPGAIFIFQMASTLTTTSGRQVVLSGGATSSHVFWQVGSSATLGTTSVLQGTIMAAQSITLDTGATLNGRALARIGAVSLDSNPIVKPAL